MTDPYEVELREAGFDFRLRIYPADAPDGTALVWLHGGAFMFGTVDMPEADQVGRRLSAQGTTVVSVDYTLAPMDAVTALPPPPPGAPIPSPEQLRAEAEAAGPRARFPVASKQVAAAFAWTIAHADELSVTPHRVALGGASAGGNIAAGSALRLRDAGREQPAGLVLVYPVLHAPLPTADAELVASLEGLPAFLTFPPESTKAINANYLGDAPDVEGYAFPGGHDVSGLPPTLIVNADRDRLRASGQQFAAELALAGVDVWLTRERGAVHGFLNEIGDAASERTLDRMGEFIAVR